MVNGTDNFILKSSKVKLKYSGDDMCNIVGAEL